jgi:NAD(P)-dependent dehydrogenase (short-subunit alcohol dehydrogenase family)
MFEFGNRNALIMGGGLNIGRQIALEFARRGARVAVADVDTAGAEETARLAQAEGQSAIGTQCDVTSEDSIAAALGKAEEALGHIDILVNNAGLLHSGNVEDMPVAEWQRMFDVNLFGAVRANALVLPKMIARKSGYIVQTASFAGLYPYATNRMPYAASKAALISMSENMAIYLRPLGVLVGCLCPGPTMTTSMHGMKSFSENVVMRGPGSDLKVLEQADVARILADGMEQERVVIPTHEQGWQTIRDHAASPDDFIRAKIEDYAAGRSGLPGR